MPGDKAVSKILFHSFRMQMSSNIWIYIKYYVMDNDWKEEWKTENKDVWRRITWIDTMEDCAKYEDFASHIHAHQCAFTEEQAFKN